MAWLIKGKDFDIEWFEELEPTEVLYEFDGPRIFTSTVKIGDLLCYLAEDDGDVLKYIVVPTSVEIIDRLKSGRITLRESLNQSWTWFIDVEYSGKINKAVMGTLKDAPEEILPIKGVMLWPHLEPLLTIRAIGNELSEGNIPITVIRQVIEGALTALKKLTSAVSGETNNQGSMRQYYDLPAVNFAYNSFEISFNRKIPLQQSLFDNDPESAIFDQMGEKLENALEWAVSSNKENSLDIELLEAIEKLIPPKTGVVNKIEIRGRFLKNRLAYSMDREITHFVRQALDDARHSQEKTSMITGMVREFDKDNLSFTLRETDDKLEHLCYFQPELFDDLFEAFEKDLIVTVHGRENLKNHKIAVSLVSSVGNNNL